MSWITVLWSMNSAVCLTLAAFYGLVWCKQRDSWVHLLFSSSAVAAAAISAFELFMMNARTVEQYQLSVRWVHVPTWLLRCRSWLSCNSISMPDDAGWRGASTVCGRSY